MHETVIMVRISYLLTVAILIRGTLCAEGNDVKNQRANLVPGAGGYGSSDIEDNYVKAINYYNESIKAKKDFSEVYRELGLLQLKTEKKNEAKKNLIKYLELAKNPKDALIIKSYLN